MKGPGSLRMRFVIGSVLWTLGLLLVTHLASIALIKHLHIFRVSHAPLVLLFAAALMAAGFIGVRRGLSPFAELRRRLAQVHEGSESRLEGRYPSEVQPLVNDLNALLDERDRRMRQALAKGGDLAHGLKTPLAVLAQEGERAEREGQAERAATIAQQVERMRRRIDHHLAIARAGASESAPAMRTPLRETAEGLVRTLERLHAERGVAIGLRVPEGLLFRGQREDLEEMLGNLLDNACKWAHSQVLLTAEREEVMVVLRVDDDGAGVEASLREVVLQRGVRADEAAPGSGLGLAIVAEIAELYGGTIALEESPLGGARARLRLPSGAN